MPRFPDDLSDAMKAEPVWRKLLDWFYASYPLGPEGERMLAELNAASERVSTGGPLDATTRVMISNLNECRVRETLGLPQVPTL